MLQIYDDIRSSFPVCRTGRKINGFHAITTPWIKLQNLYVWL